MVKISVLTLLLMSLVGCSAELGVHEYQAALEACDGQKGLRSVRSSFSDAFIVAECNNFKRIRVR